MTLQEKIDFLQHYDGPDMTIMEVCGSHTAAISKNGIRSLLSDKIHLISGPGCPVCVTPSAYVDRLIELSLKSNYAVVTFGDLLRVPGSASTLQEAKGSGADVRMVYAPFDLLDMAENEPDKTFVYAAVGFETTTPLYALLMEEVLERGLKNVQLLTALKTMPSVISYLCDQGANVDGFLAPGHVSVVTGYAPFEPLAEKYHLPFGVAGFTGENIIETLYTMVKHREEGRVFNHYPSVVTRNGNEEAQRMVEKYFTKTDAVWRGMGSVAGSGMVLKEEYASYDAGSYELVEDRKINKACRCDKVLIGQIRPSECPLFGKVCTPLTPQGACMVSGEGSCRSMYQM
ncbi:MAG: hydrogenase formation protein HypD [Lachnospiraceae bacterium]|nr:hydrogenase formation protein HypD [Candidatus Equihabitans merdae]